MLWIFEITLVLGLVLNTGAKPSYNVVAPRTIRPNTNYFIAISVDGTDGELQVGNTGHHGMVLGFKNITRTIWGLFIYHSNLGGNMI